MNMLLNKKFLLLALVVTGMLSCRKVLDEVKPGVELDYSQMYQDVYDANAAVMGIYGKFMNLSDRYIILNELRADLMEYTGNADEYLRQISTHSVTPDNPYASPRPFYEIIIDCNDVLKNLETMRDQKKLTQDQFDQRYSDIGCLRSFLYLQLGIHWGEIPYVTNPLATVDDVKNESLFPTVRLEDGSLLDSLINFTEALPFKDLYPVDITNGLGASLNISLDGYPTERFFINKKVLLGDLYLWKGNYTRAATYYREVMESQANTSGDTYYTKYRVGWGDANLYVTYTRAGDASSLSYTSGWPTIFTSSAKSFDREVIWALPFDSKFKPDNPLVKLFSPFGGDYLVKPSQAAFDYWNAQEQVPVAVAGSDAGIPYDARGLLSVRDIGGQPVITKFIASYLDPLTGLPFDLLNKTSEWFLFRQAHLHLRFAEAANRDGYPKLAYALFNDGIKRAYDSSAIRDKTDLMNTFMYPDPYKFDAREGSIPYYRGAWYRNDGIRTRARLTPYPLTASSVPDSISQIEIGLLNEDALETAFEGTRWADLLRISIRRNDPALIADKIYAKLVEDGAPNAAQARSKLMNRDWYLPFNW